MTQKKALVPTTPAPVDEYAGHDWGDSGIEDLEPSYPLLKIVQAVSKMDGAGRHGGDFWVSDTESFVSTPTVVPLYRVVTRAMFAEASEKPDCSSPDGLYPRTGSSYWMENGLEMPNSCAECPMSEWGADGAPPACRESWVFLVDLDGQLVQLRVSGKNLKPWRTFITRRLRPKHLPLFSHKIELSTERKVEGQNTWYEMVLRPEMLPLAKAMEYSAAMQHHKTTFETTTEAAAEEWVDV